MKTSLLRRLVELEDLNFLLTNRIPRQALTQFMGWFSQIRSPRLARLSIKVWRQFTDLDLSDAETTQFNSLHECFTRRLKPGARTFDPNPKLLSSPSDAIVGACGRIQQGQLLQAKGFPYRLEDLLGPSQDASVFHSGSYVTLRLTSAMYHHFHAPCAGRLEHITYLSGDTWNVNPIALQRVERLFCRNERAVLNIRVAEGGAHIALVPVAAILVASLRLLDLNIHLHLRYKGPNEIPVDLPLSKGQELGWFEHGSTIILLAPSGFELLPHVKVGHAIRAGDALMRFPGG